MKNIFNTFSIFIIYISIITAIGIGSQAQDNSKTATAIADVLIEVETSPLDKVKETSPKELEKKRFLLNSLEKTKSLTINSTRATADFIKYEFTPSASAFYLGSLFQVMRKILTHPESDAQMLKNFFTNNILSVNAQVSFSFFIIGSKITNSYISKVAERTNWIKDEKKILEVTKSIVNKKNGNTPFNPLSTFKISQKQKQEWHEARKEAEKLTQGKFTQAQLNKFKIFSGFGMGFLASTIYNDLSTDEDLNYFAQALVSTPEEIEQLIIKFGYTPVEAYEKAYERWVTKGKIKDYIPHILSSWTTIAIQSFLLPFISQNLGTLGSKIFSKSNFTKKRFFLKSIQFVEKVGSYFPSSRLFSAATHAFIFLEINEPILHIYEKIYEKEVYGDLTINYLNEISKLNLRPAIPQSCLEQFKKIKTFDEKIFNTTSYNQIKKFSTNSESVSCELSPSFTEVLNNFHQSMNHWRSFWLKDAANSLETWSSYLQSFSNHYDSSYKFYKLLINEINSIDNPNFSPYPFYGISSSENKNIKETTIASVITKLFFILENEIKYYQNQKIKSGPAPAIIDIYKKMFEYLAVFDDTKQLPPSLTYEIQRIEKNSLNIEQKKLQIALKKEAFAAKSFEIFKRALIYNPEISDKSNDSIHQLGKVKEILIFAENLKQGEMLIKEASLDKVINFEVPKKNDNLYNAYFRNYAEKYLISAACGPIYSLSGKHQTSLLSEEILNKIPFWSTSYTPPRIVSVDTYNACSDFSGINYYNTKPIYYNNNRYDNLVMFIKDNINTAFKGPNAIGNFEQFWKDSVDKEINSFLSKQEAKFLTLLKEKLYPSLFSNEKYSSSSQSLELGAYNSYAQEIKVYISLLKRIAPNNLEDIKKAESKFNLFKYIASNPNRSELWLPEAIKIDSSFKENFESISSISNNPYTKTYLFLENFLKKRIFDDLFKNIENQNSTFTSDQIEVILEIADLLNKSLSGLTQTLSYFKIFEYVGKK